MNIIGKRGAGRRMNKEEYLKIERKIMDDEELNNEDVLFNLALLDILREEMEKTD